MAIKFIPSEEVIRELVLYRYFWEYQRGSELGDEILKTLDYIDSMIVAPEQADHCKTYLRNAKPS